MVEIKIIYRIIFFFFFFCLSCKKENNTTINTKENQDSTIIFKKRISDSILSSKKNQEQYQKTIAKNKKFLESIIFEKINYNTQSDYNNIKSVLLKTLGQVDFTYLHKKTNANGIIYKTFGLANYLEYKEPFKEYWPFINKSKKSIDFILSYGESDYLPLKISFSQGQHFILGKNFKWITPKINIKDTTLADYQHFNKISFLNPNFFINRGGSIIEFNKKKYLLFTFWDGMWCIHHLFDLTHEKKIKYYILNSIYTDEDGYCDFNNDGKLDFKQKYFYVKNSLDHSKDRFKIYTIE